MPDRGGRAGLAQEPFAGGRGGGQLRGQHLDRDDAVQHLVEGPEHDAEAAPTEDLQHLVMPEPAERAGSAGWGQEGRAARRPGADSIGGRLQGRRARVPGSGQGLGGTWSTPGTHGRGRAEETALRVMGAEQRFDSFPQLGIAPARLVQVGRAGGLVRQLGGLKEDHLSRASGRWPWGTPGLRSPLNARTDAVCLTESGKNSRQSDSSRGDRILEPGPGVGPVAVGGGTRQAERRRPHPRSTARRSGAARPPERRPGPRQQAG